MHVLEPTAEFPAQAGDLLCTPLDGHPLEILPDIVSDPYNPPLNNQDGRHMGVDFSYYTWGERDTIKGVPVHSIFPGVVAGVFAQDTIPYGYAVIVESTLEQAPLERFSELGITTGESVYVMYAHMDQPPQVIPDQEVACGELLGFVGQTGGESTPYLIPHLHVEMRLGPPGERFEEMGFYDTRLSELARQTYLRWRLSGTFRHFDPMLVLSIENGSE